MLFRSTPKLSVGVSANLYIGEFGVAPLPYTYFDVDAAGNRWYQSAGKMTNRYAVSAQVGVLYKVNDKVNLGATEFTEHINYRRALEGELARTIGTIGDVASARVHIALAKPSLFASQDQAAKASVVLKLRNNRPLAPPTIVYSFFWPPKRPCSSM